MNMFIKPSHTNMNREDILWLKGQRLPKKSRIKEMTKNGFKSALWRDVRLIWVKNATTGAVELRCFDGGHSIMVWTECFPGQPIPCVICEPNRVFTEIEAKALLGDTNLRMQRNMKSSQVEQNDASSLTKKEDKDLWELMKKHNFASYVNPGATKEELGLHGMDSESDTFGHFNASYRVDFKPAKTLFLEYGKETFGAVLGLLDSMLTPYVAGDSLQAEIKVPKGVISGLAEIHKVNPKLFATKGLPRQTGDKFRKGLDAVLNIRSHSVKTVNSRLNTAFSSSEKNNANELSSALHILDGFKELHSDQWTSKNINSIYRELKHKLVQKENKRRK